MAAVVEHPSASFGSLPGRHPRADGSMPIALAIALIAHALLIASLEWVAPERARAPRSTEPLALMVIAQPGVESLTAALTGAPAAERAAPTQALRPEAEAVMATASPTAATERREPTAPVSSPSAPEQPLEPSSQAAPPAVPAAAAPVLFATAAGLDVDGRFEPELEPERIQASEAATLPESEASALLEQDIPESPSISAADIFASRTAEMAHLSARSEERRTTHTGHTRRKAISSSTRDHLYANYLEAWRRKAERIGNLNYPREARELGLYGNLTLHVSVRSDGTLEGVRVVRSSGHAVLDQAAVRIVELAAPFAPFPPGIKRDTDVLDITAPWQFQRNHQLGWGR